MDAYQSSHERPAAIRQPHELFHWLMILILSLLFYRKYKVRKQIDESNKGGADVRQFEFLLRKIKLAQRR